MTRFWDWICIRQEIIWRLFLIIYLKCVCMFYVSGPMLADGYLHLRTQMTFWMPISQIPRYVLYPGQLGVHTTSNWSRIETGGVFRCWSGASRQPPRSGCWGLQWSWRCVNHCAGWTCYLSCAHCRVLIVNAIWTVASLQEETNLSQKQSQEPILAPAKKQESPVKEHPERWANVV